MEKYIYGIRTVYNEVIITVTKKENWINHKEYSKDCPKDLVKIFKSLGYEKTIILSEFHNAKEKRQINEIIEELNKYDFLEYDEDFNELTLTHVYSFMEDEDVEGVYIVHVTPKLYWITENEFYDFHSNTIITEFLEGLGFYESMESVFDSQVDVDEDEVKNSLSEFKYLEYNKEFDDCIKDEI